MTDHPAHRDVLDGIYDLGERLHAALEAGDVDGFDGLVEQRGALVARLVALPRQENEDWSVHATLHQQQHARILTAATAHEKRLTAAQGRLKQVKHARTHYGQQPARPRVLNKDLCG